MAEPLVLEVPEDKPRKTKAVVKANGEPSEPDHYLALATSLAANKDVDVAAIRELLTLRREEANEAARKEFIRAKNAAEAEMEPIRKDARNPDTKSKYATHAALDAAMRPIYTKHGFAFGWNTGIGDGSPMPPDCVRVLGKLSHTSGHEEPLQIDMPCDGKGPKGGNVMSRTHATASGFSYGRRYLQSGAFNIVFVGEDDDGNAAARKTGPITDAQADALLALISETKTEPPKFLSWASTTFRAEIKCVSDISTKDYPRALVALQAKKAEQKKARA